MSRSRIVEFDSKVLRIQLEVIVRIFLDEIEVCWLQIVDIYVHKILGASE